MNAGANGSETSDCLESVLYLYTTGETCCFKRSELSFGYRTSPFQAMKGCILSAKFILRYNDEARVKQRKNLELRIKTQPLKAKSAGCIFRNPSKEVSAGALIDQCGLKGLAVGDATVSPIHANFIVNEGYAKAADVVALIQKIQAVVLEKTGTLLEPEIKIW
jgi:UDP-N-acetylmuramate dehydrogenase